MDRNPKVPRHAAEAFAPHFRREKKLAKSDLWPIAGMDEVGRGPLAGPVAAAAVILDPECLPKGVNDSKALERDEREELYEKILECTVAVAVAFVSAAEIDLINIRQASLSRCAARSQPSRSSRATC